MSNAKLVAETEVNEPVFDVYVRKPIGVDGALVRQQALIRKLMSADKLDKLLQALELVGDAGLGAAGACEFCRCGAGSGCDAGAEFGPRGGGR